MMVNIRLIQKIPLVFKVLLLVSLVAGCSQQPAKDVVAEVNGVPIFFYEMNAHRDMLFQGLSQDGLPPNDEELRQQYAYSLTSIIEQELVRQYLKRKGIHVDDTQTVKEEALVQGDYPSPEEFKDALIENGVSLDLWHQMMRRRQDVLTLTSQILRPKVLISSSEVEQFYLAHRDEFQVSEQLDFLYIEGGEKESVIMARDLFLKTRDASLSRSESDVIMRDIRLSPNRLPESIVKEVSSLTPYDATVIKKEGDHYYTYILREKVPAGTLDIGQTFQRIEQILVEERVQELLTAWLEREFAKATIRILAPLLEEIEIPVDKTALFVREYSGVEKGTDAELVDEAETDDDYEDTYGVEFFAPLGTPQWEDAHSYDTDTVESLEE